MGTILREKQGFGFIDIIVGTALMLIIFVGFVAVYQYAIKVTQQSQARIVALTLANQKMEYIRNLSYTSIGTVGGIPNGTIPQTETITRGDLTFTLNTLVSYVDDPFDGLAPADTVPGDYKRVRLDIAWNGPAASDVVLLSDVAPRGLESTIGGGNILINAFNSSGVGIPQADINIVNNTVNPLINLNVQTNNQGTYLVAGAPTSTAGYRITVSNAGYSTERTYGVSQIAHPAKPDVTVLDGKLTQVSFSIDLISTFDVYTFSPWGSGTFIDSFANETYVNQKSQVVVSGVDAHLSSTPGVYYTSGATDADLCEFPGTKGDCGQSFTVGASSKQISKVKLFVKKATVNPSPIFFEIRSDSPIGSVVATSNSVSSSTLSNVLAWTTFTLQSPVTLTANTQYFLRLRSTPDSTDPGSYATGTVYWGYLFSNAGSPPSYSGGSAWRYTGRNNTPADQGQEFGPPNQYDFSFNIYDDEYAPSGYLISNDIAPIKLSTWDKVTWVDTRPANTSILYQLLYFDGAAWVPVPNSQLAGNTPGFSSGPVNISGLSTSTYPILRIKGDLATTDIAVTPSISDWELSWITASSTAIGNVPFRLTGAKIIGTDINDKPVYKYTKSLNTDASSHLTLAGLEGDSYTFSLDPATTTLTLAAIDPAPQPIVLSPNSTQIVNITLAAQNSLLATVRDEETGNPILSAQIRLYNVGIGYDQTQFANGEGKSIFIPVPAATHSYQITAAGYQTKSGTIAVSGGSNVLLLLQPL